MPIQALQFVYKSQGVAMGRAELGLDLIRAQLAAGFAAEPIVYLIRVADCGEIVDCVEDLGVMQQKGKELSRYLLGRKGVPLLEGQYTSCGRIRQGITSFLRRAAQSGERKIYIIAAPDALVDVLWNEPHHETSPAGGLPGAASGHGLLDLLRLQETWEQRVILQDVSQTFAGDSDEADLVRHLILKAAETDEPVLILGETGTGKELVARAIHNLREAAKKKRGEAMDGQFVAINCAAIPNELLESELFGHKKGAFTHATADKRGLWEVATGGTLFLDEIAEMPPEQQTKVLRALQHHEIRRLGSTEIIPARARIIAATNQNLKAMMQAKVFRDDLYYRLNGLVITTPPLRSQPEQIARLAQLFWRSIAASPANQLLPDALAELASYPWPGNIRELKKVLRTLRALFADMDVGGEQVRAVLQTREISRPAQDAAPVDVAQHRAQSLQCLRRAAEVISALKSALTPASVSTSQNLAPPSVETVRSSLRAPLAELEMLCLRPLLFRSFPTYDKVARLREKVTHLLELRPEAFTAAIHTISCEIDAVLAALFMEVEELLAQP